MAEAYYPKEGRWLRMMTSLRVDGGCKLPSGAYFAEADYTIEGRWFSQMTLRSVDGSE